MFLYVLDITDVCAGVAENVSRKCNVNIHNVLTLMIERADSDLLNTVVRKTHIDCREGDWEVYGSVGTIMTVFRGNRFGNIMGSADVVLSSNPDITVSYMGRVNATLLYDKYIKEERSRIYIGNIMCSNVSGCNTYATMLKDDPLKKISVGNQLDTIVGYATEDYKYEPTSIESRLMMGKDVM
jgi:hypothetical protein